MEKIRDTVVCASLLLLRDAVIKGDVRTLQDQLRNNFGVDINNPVDCNRNSLLHLATLHENTDIIDDLLSNGAVVNVQNNVGETPLHKVALGTKNDIVEKLLENGASVNIYNMEGHTPFHIAVSKGYKKIIEPMLDRGAEVHSRAAKKETCLHIATTHCNCILVETLLDRGADVNARDISGLTPLHVAVSRVDVTMTQLLLERGANINAVDNNGQTPLHLAAENWNCRLVKTLLDKGSLINTQNLEGQTALHVAVKNADLTMVNRLLDRGALTDPSDLQGLSPLHYAVHLDHAKLALKLLSRGAAVDALFPTLDVCPRTKPLILPYIIKLQVAGLCESVVTQDEYSQLREMCVKELERIKLKKLNDVLLYNLFYRPNLFDLPKYKQLEKALNYPDLESEFPLYAFVIRVYLLKVKKRLSFLSRAQLFFIVLHKEYKSFCILPASVRRNILIRLSDIDLQNLIVYSENILRSKSLP